MLKVPVHKTILTIDIQIIVIVSDDYTLSCRVWVEKREILIFFQKKDKRNIMVPSDLVGSCAETENCGLCEGWRGGISSSVSQTYTCLEILKCKDRNTQKNIGVRTGKKSALIIHLFIHST